MTITINGSEVFLAAKKALDEGRLSAFVNDQNDSCEYRDEEGNPCAVGAAFTDDQAASLIPLGMNGQQIAHLCTEGVVRVIEDVPGFDERRVVLLQLRHDAIANARAVRDPRSIINRRKRTFKDFLNKKLAELTAQPLNRSNLTRRLTTAS
jgi:hypothetical protein